MSAGAATPNLPACVESTDYSYCGFHRPEDISVVPGGDWIVVSQDSTDAPLQLLNTQAPGQRFGQLPYAGASPRSSACDGPPDVIRPRGHSIGQFREHQYLAVINSEPSNRIEFFQIRLESGNTGLVWQECVAVPDQLMLNDLAFGPNDTLYASHMFDLPKTEQEAETLQAAFVEGRNTGFAVRYSAAQGWSPVSGTEVSFANGIAVSDDLSTLVVAGTYSQAVVLLNLQTGAYRSMALPLQPDNITTLANGQFLVAGHTGTPFTGIAPCRPANSLPCGFPFAVVRFQEGVEAEVIFAHDGSSIPGASVAVPLPGDRLLLGSAFGDRLSAREVAGMSAKPMAPGVMRQN